MARPRATVEEPEGLRFAADFLRPDEEEAVLDVLDELDFREVVMRGQTARRTVRHFGFDYDYEGWGLTPAEPLPESLLWLRDRCAHLAGLDPVSLAQTLVSRYPEGAGIGWHRDAPMFGAKLVGVSLLSSCRMRFQRGKGQERRVFELELPPRSAYVLAGAARSAWQHSIPATKTLRYSITFRTLANPARWSGSRSAV
ncbi:MAG: alpha-ketoglutarate-dependent dioxygenase AlkB [Actinobacteria bacterium]|nr:alpha-ketoglutarate-dependent dioxygenase AlkB [Actinomycetota bacterium]